MEVLSYLINGKIKGKSKRWQLGESDPPKKKKKFTKNKNFSVILIWFDKYKSNQLIYNRCKIIMLKMT